MAVFAQDRQKGRLVLVTCEDWNGSAWVTIGSYTVLMDSVRRVIDVWASFFTPHAVARLEERVRELADTVEKYYESGENLKKPVL